MLYARWYGLLHKIGLIQNVLAGISAISAAVPPAQRPIPARSNPKITALRLLPEGNPIRPIGK